MKAATSWRFASATPNSSSVRSRAFSSTMFSRRLLTVAFTPPSRLERYPNTRSVGSMRKASAMDSARSLLVSVRPRFAALILDGTKTVELRRVRPAVLPGAMVVIYASSPLKGLVGTGTVEAIEVGALDRIWDAHGERAAVTRDEYDAYFGGADRAVAIELTDVQRLSRPR